MNSDYSPISCVDHERLEFAVLRRIPLTLLLRDGRNLTGQVLDVYARGGAEWLRLREPTGDEHEVRLDEIETIREPRG
jgi:transcriptional antiterminator Rof (Rho-off)